MDETMPKQPESNDLEFSLEPEVVPESFPAVEGKKSAARKQTAKVSIGAGEPQVISYRHADRRRNNPQVGLVNENTDPGQPKTMWRYDPHIDPALAFDTGRAQVETLIDNALASGDEAAMRAALEELRRMQSPYLNWTGKAERTSFDVDTVSLHVHERVDAMSILAAVRKRMHEAKVGKASPAVQPDLFNAPFENLPLRDALDFYKHERGWANRLVAGDSLLVMNSLLQKESMAGQVQMIYIDPPYGIKYGSNFQPFVNKRDVKDRKDEDLTQEPEMIRAFRDTWELGVHSYLTYLRDRLLLARELLHESGSCFVQIGDENAHHVRELMDEVFGAENLIATINFRTKMPLESGHIESVFDHLCWYARDKASAKYRNLFAKKRTGPSSEFVFVDEHGGGFRRLSQNEIATIDPKSPPERLFKRSDLASAGYTASCTFPIEFDGVRYTTGGRKSWRTNPLGVERLIAQRRLFVLGKKLYYKLYFADFGYQSLVNSWNDTIEFEGRS